MESKYLNIMKLHKCVFAVIMLVIFSTKVVAEVAHSLDITNDVDMNNLYSCTGLFEALSNTTKDNQQKSLYSNLYNWFTNIERDVEDLIKKSNSPTKFHVYRKMGVSASLFYLETIKSQNQEDLQMMDYQIDVCVKLVDKTGYKF